MEKSLAEKTPFSKFMHVGMVVRDIDKAIEHLSSFGIGPFEKHTSTPLIERQFRGKPANWQTKRSTAKMGQLEIELLQPVEGESAAKEFLESKGEGIHHIGFAVDDLDREMAKLVRQGAKVVMSGKWAGGGFAYLEIDAIGGLIIELIQ